MRHLTPRRGASSGMAAVEFALVLPLLLLLVVCLVDIARAIQANMILLSLSREGANLAARGALPLKDGSQAIIGALASTAPPLDMNARGMIYITKIMGNKDKSGAIRNVVLEQYRWDDRAKNLGWTSSNYRPASSVWNCNNWGTDGSCKGIPAPDAAPAVSLMEGALSDGELIYAVESFYNFNMLFGGLTLGAGSLPVIGPNLHAMTVF
jgi:hypothetical protein